MRGQAIFTAVSDSQEKATALADLVKYHTEIKVKGPDSKHRVLTLTPQILIGNSVQCTKADSENLEDGIKEVVVQFHLSDQKYIAHVKTKVNQNVVTLDFSTVLYRVQRREYFRLKLPSSYKGKLAFEHGGLKSTAKLLDISAGGCRIEVPATSPLRSKDKFFAVLSTLQHDDVKVECEVRHIAAEEGVHLVGLQFVNQTEIIKNRMVGMVMDLYREFFKRV